jgi:hypothetical protein
MFCVQVSVEVLEFKNLIMGRRLGQGAEGAVYEARYQDQPVAVKESPALNEIEMYLSSGVHDNIVGLRGLCQKVRYLFCNVFVRGQSLFNLLREAEDKKAHSLKQDLVPLGVWLDMHASFETALPMDMFSCLNSWFIAACAITIAKL